MWMSANGVEVEGTEPFQECSRGIEEQGARTSVFPGTLYVIVVRIYFRKDEEERSSMMKIRPLQDRVIVKRLEEEERTSGGIIIPDTAKEKPQQGKVVAVGKGRILEKGDVVPPVVKEGDRVLFSKYAGTEVKFDGEELLIMREDDILGILG
jgi:chaperonin GroES